MFVGTTSQINFLKCLEVYPQRNPKYWLLNIVILIFNVEVIAMMPTLSYWKFLLSLFHSTITSIRNEQNIEIEMMSHYDIK